MPVQARADEAGNAQARAGALPVLVGAPRIADRGPAPARVRVQVLDRNSTERAGVRGVLLRVGRADADVRAAAVDITIDYRQFRTAYGADWASRLRLTLVPECMLAAPRQKCAAITPLPSRNDPRAGTVAATVPLPAGSAGVTAPSALIAVSAASTGPAGSFAATSLQPSSTWTAGGSSGDFTWSYPMRVPPAPGGPVPTVGLAYSAQSVDGRHAASNNQPSWLGEGFETTAGGFIERRYEGCAEDMEDDANNTKKTGDLCWATDNAVLSLGGHSGDLIYNAATDRWRLRNDDGSRVQRHTGASNGDNNGEYWVVTTGDGVQYWFGKHRLPGWSSGEPVTNSTWTVPVYGNHVNEPCHATAFANSSCHQAWRWNLDYVVDRHGNSASYWYQTETNKYARNVDSDDVVSYVRGGYLDRIDYATRRTGDVDSIFTSDAPARVDFDVDDRCLSGCGTHDESHWPDTPWDQECTESTCETFSPTFWSTKRLKTVTTRIRNGTDYRDVERWTLTHTFPDPGDGTRAGLWLSKLSHTGLVGTAVNVPDVEFAGVQRENRVDTIDFAAAMNWWRISQIRYETGGTLSVLYSDPDCVAGTRVPSEPASNTLLCYPVRWTPEGYDDPVVDYFHKYLVTTVYQADNTGGAPPNGSPPTVTTYRYLGDPAWHYSDDDGLIEKKDKTWSVWRGYAKVAVITGDAGEQTYQETTYFRGMHGDRAASGTRTVPVTGTGVPTVNDEDAYAGMTRETTVFDGPGGAVVSKQVHEPWQSPPTASRTVNGDAVHARYTGTLASHERTTLDGGRGERVRTIRNTLDAYGMPTAVDDSGDTAVTGDEICTRSTYEPRNTNDWLLMFSHRVRSFALPCRAAGDDAELTDSDLISDTRTTYDNQAHGTAPTEGLVTKTENANAWNAGNPDYDQVSRAAYDAQGRITNSWDALDNEITTVYEPAGLGLVTQTVVTNPLDHVTTTTIEPAWGVPTSITDPNGKRTETGYDGLGRLTAVWEAGRDKNTQTANTKYSYLLRNDAPSVVSTHTLNAAGNYLDTHTLYDGLLRPRQTQSWSASGGRLLTDTFYDTAGRSVRTHGAYHAAGAPGTELTTATDWQDIANQTTTEYDGTGRPTAEIFHSYSEERWRTSRSFGGDRTDVTPPAGGTAASTVTDAHGRTVAVRQYHASTPTGTYDATSYSYNRKGQLAEVTDAAGNAWSYTYDVRGRQVTAADPDKGLTTSGYDVGGRLTSTVDARNVRLTYTYDALNRRTAVQQPGVGTRARWTYDTIAKGHLYQSVRFVGTASYTTRITAYDDAYRPTDQSVIIPATETGLAGTYTFGTSYNADGTIAARNYPATAGLPAESVSYVYDETTGMPVRANSNFNNTALSYVSQTGYNALGQVTTLQLYTGVHTGLGARVDQTFTHELGTGRLTAVRTDRQSVSPFTVANTEYEYDDAGNITRVSDVATGDHQCFEYDHLRRLNQAWTPTSGTCDTPSTARVGGPAPYWQSWTYDVTGNRLSQNDHATSAGGMSRRVDYTYPDAGSARPHAVTGRTTTIGASATTVGYAYDLAGNTLTRPSAAGTQTLTWDPEGHLANSVDSTGTTEYIYDADGNRLIRRDPSGRTLYLPGQELRYTTATDTVACTRYYTYRNATIASRTTAGLTWLSADHQGTATVAIDAATQQATIRRQTPFGESRGGTPLWPNSKGFVGGIRDNTGLTHLGAREYDPDIGRFISVDPVQDLNDPQQWNAYAYSNNSPVTLSDPDGLKPLIGNSGWDEPSLFDDGGYKLTNKGGKWTTEKIRSSKWFDYYRNTVIPPKDVKFDPVYGWDVKETTLFGAATVYDKDGNLIASDDNFRSGGGTLDGETSRWDKHVEPRVVKWYESAGVLKPGSTLYITVNEPGRESCTQCAPLLRKTADRLGIRVVYEAPGAAPVVYGENHAKAPLKGAPAAPKRPLKSTTPKVQPAPPAGLFDEPSGKPGGAPPKGPSGNVGRGIGGAAGVVGVGADIYFFGRYGPCGLMPVDIPQCRPPLPGSTA
ncbi:RHS repeat-associated core domain-containing protein [Plantactinospora sp. KLBMP9567]|uniref:RHS repeat domain-containing protein n=1 Tax=Plantactinospora sp. KLBMP9567 TaxID=3085900 RepID=UPI0029826E4B|nr:RHS repeat-associated core domain-containing protein [Plantactinospora sp. KLBMP9567]MDW5329924.1 RHS repeat-associated core domain-containing protein [Plantactinospora sp. KLBMP9567]